MPTANAEVEPWQTIEAQLERRQSLGLNEPLVARWVLDEEFISLGSFCGVSSALQALGVKSGAYPFDWLRAPMDGLIHLFNTDFEEFFTYTSVEQVEEHLVFMHTSWGGSFWHHDLEDTTVQQDLLRRVKRLLGRGEVPPTRNRFFVRALNSHRELHFVAQLYAALCSALPQCRVTLLILLDFQSSHGAFRLAGCGSRVLFVNVPREMSQDNSLSWDMRNHAEAYAGPLAFACRCLAGCPVAVASVVEARDVRALLCACSPYNSGDCGTQTLQMRPMKGHQLLIDGARQRAGKAEGADALSQDGDQASVTSSTSTTPTPTDTPTTPGSEGSWCTLGAIPQRIQGSAVADQGRAKWGSVPGRTAAADDLFRPGPPPQVQPEDSYDFVLPVDAQPGAIVEASAFGMKIHLRVPQNLGANKTLRLHLKDGKVSCATVYVAA